MTHRFEELRDTILAHSEEKIIWRLAVLEWKHISTTRNLGLDNGIKCVCGTPIVEECTIRNLTNGAELVVGNVCVERFLGGNPELVADAAVAHRALGRRDCAVCGCSTLHPVMCKRCEKKTLADEAARQRISEAEAQVARELEARTAQRRAAIAADLQALRVKNAQRVARWAALDADLHTHRGKNAQCLAKWAALDAQLDPSKMTAMEREFVYCSVQSRVLKGEKLTDRQREWLLKIGRRHRRRATA